MYVKIANFLFTKLIYFSLSCSSLLMIVPALVNPGGVADD